MPITSLELAQKLREQMEAKKIQPPELAAFCGVRVPSVYDWMEHGRIAKKHLPRFAEFFNTSLAYWLGVEEDEEDLDPLERHLLAIYRQLKDSFRDRLLQDANHLLNLQDPEAPPGVSNPFPRAKPLPRKKTDDNDGD